MATFISNKLKIPLSAPQFYRGVATAKEYLARNERGRGFIGRRAAKHDAIALRAKYAKKVKPTRQLDWAMKNAGLREKSAAWQWRP